jgi:DNA-binding PadR family transcriptional regulator
LVASTESNGDGRVVYTITDRGRDAAREWMQSPVSLAAAGRDEISLKVLMSLASGVEDPRRVIEKQRGSTMTLLQDYTNLKGDGQAEDDLAWLLHLDRLILSAEAELRWLERVEARLEDLGPTTPAKAAHVEQSETEEVSS